MTQKRCQNGIINGTVTIKEIIYAMFELGINRYEQKHGKEHVRKPKGEKDLF
jgi:hypothetical protein